MNEESKVINMLAVTHHSRENINPIRPEASQVIGLHLSGKVKVTALCNPNSTLIPFYEQHGIEVLTDPLDKKLSLSTIRKIRQLIHEKNIDILHLFNNIACSNGATAAIGTNVKVIAYRGQTGNISRIDPASYLSMLHPRLDKIICVAKAVELELKTHLGRHKDKAVTVYKGHDASWYQKPKADLSSLKLPEDSFIISLVANLRPRKGLPVLMEALSLLPKDTNIDVLLVGADPTSPKIQALIESSGRIGRVHALGYRTDAPEVAAASHLTVLPTTKREGLCRAVLEANSYGVPAIVSDTGGNAELVKDGHTGIVVPPSEPQLLADAILKLYNDRELCSVYGKNAKERAINKFNVEQGVNATFDVYLSLMK
jgi:L-malate glycosyltransferase